MYKKKKQKQKHFTSISNQIIFPPIKYFFFNLIWEYNGQLFIHNIFIFTTQIDYFFIGTINLKTQKKIEICYYKLKWYKWHKKPDKTGENILCHVKVSSDIISSFFFLELHIRAINFLRSCWCQTRENISIHNKWYVNRKTKHIHLPLILSIFASSNKPATMHQRNEVLVSSKINSCSYSPGILNYYTILIIYFYLFIN